MRASLASWGVFILATTATLGTGTTTSDGVLYDDQQEIVSACCDENQGKDANVIAEDGITFPRPPLWTNPLVRLSQNARPASPRLLYSKQSTVTSDSRCR